MTTSGAEQKGSRRLALLGGGALLTALLIGGSIALGGSPDPTTSTRETADQSASATQREIVEDRPAGNGVRGWPTTTQNQAGRYSWDRRTCAFGQSCVLGFMHNGYASGDVQIVVEATSRSLLPRRGETAVTVAGHDGLHRRVDARTEEWIVGIQGTTIAIRLEARPGASDADRAEAHAIIDSMRTEPQDTKLGFRLVFRLMTDDWDSG